MAQQNGLEKRNLFHFSPQPVMKPTGKARNHGLYSSKFVKTPSPLDHISGGLKERALQFGLSPQKDNFLLNQSFPAVFKETETGNETQNMGDVRKCALSKFNGDALNSFNFSPNQARELFLKTSDSSRALNTSWAFCNYVSGGSPTRHMQVHNPNKAIVTINAKTTEILVANKMASTLLGSKSDSIGGRKLCDFFVAKKDHYSLGEVELEESGELVFISGRVMDIITTDQKIIPVSVWARRIENEEEPRCLVVMEPVDRTTATVVFDQKGQITSCDKSFASLYGYASSQDIEGLSILDLIPSLIFPLPAEGCSLPKAIEQQRATGRTKDGTTFPLSIHLKPHASKSYGQEGGRGNSDHPTSGFLYHGIIWVFANISGLITVLPDGTIHSCNTNFSLMLFGYTQNQLAGKAISLLIPSFYDDLEFLDTDSIPLPPLDDDDDDSHARYGNSIDGRNTADSSCFDMPRPINPMVKCIGRPTIEETINGIQNLDLSPSPNNIGRDFATSAGVLPWDPASHPEIRISKRPFSFPASPCCAKLCSPIFDISESSLHADDSKQLSISESQDTLHSESDINANILESPRNEDRASRSPRLRGLPSGKSSVCDTSSNFSFDSDTDNGNSPDDIAEIKFNCMGTPRASNSVDFDRETVGLNPRTSSGIDDDDLLSPHSAAFSLSTPNKNSLTRQLGPAIHSLSDDSLHSIPEGGYYGTGRHLDGTHLAIFYQIRKVELEDGRYLYCLWVSRHISGEDHGEHQKPMSSATTVSGHTSVLSQSTLHDSYSTEFSGNSTNNSIDFEDSMLSVGAYCEKYSVLQDIGKGAFGCVKKSCQHSDGLLVITKFIKKNRVHKELFVLDITLNREVPLEVSLLISLNHPNIVKVLDVFENEKYIQMVMEKHGAGMDLFEFIERKPLMDEALASYIFRQIVSAISYLHSLFIIHRDIKDENMILDEKFHVKLIDFGSATFMGDTLFSTFCGTMEYCSPEVINGEKYRGPELEMWALGVTLYTLIFGEHPFVDLEETLTAELHPNRIVSSGLMSLIQHLLDPSPTFRCTLQEVQDHPWTNQPVVIEKYKFQEVISASAEEANPTRYLTDNLYERKSQSTVRNKFSESVDSLVNAESSYPNRMVDDADYEEEDIEVDRLSETI